VRFFAITRFLTIFDIFLKWHFWQKIQNFPKIKKFCDTKIFRHEKTRMTISNIYDHPWSRFYSTHFSFCLLHNFIFSMSENFSMSKTFRHPNFFMTKIFDDENLWSLKFFRHRNFSTPTFFFLYEGPRMTSATKQGLSIQGIQKKKIFFFFFIFNLRFLQFYFFIL